MCVFDVFLCGRDEEGSGHVTEHGVSHPLSTSPSAGLTHCRPHPLPTSPSAHLTLCRPHPLPTSPSADLTLCRPHPLPTSPTADLTLCHPHPLPTSSSTYVILCRPHPLPTSPTADLTLCRPHPLPTSPSADLTHCRPHPLPTSPSADLTLCRPHPLPTSPTADLTHCRPHPLPSSPTADLILYIRHPLPTSPTADLTHCRPHPLPTSPTADLILYIRHPLPTSPTADLTHCRPHPLPTSPTADLTLCHPHPLPTSSSAECGQRAAWSNGLCDRPRKERPAETGCWKRGNHQSHPSQHLLALCTDDVEAPATAIAAQEQSTEQRIKKEMRVTTTKRISCRRVDGVKPPTVGHCERGGGGGQRVEKSEGNVLTMVITHESWMDTVPFEKLTEAPKQTGGIQQEEGNNTEGSEHHCRRYLSRLGMDILRISRRMVDPLLSWVRSTL
ncbi:hypothetical protein BLNAU_20452 [Blattamonas nauphoetae]|uniref:Uncharacterized protein n=1 Tax=Blattamonas nauphoetae TaxID=2049346 RepID=A0ABQ9WZA9_9EUKA|nr:hypothetical protein BLNAU_20452 [Blattamonas nauphoetae]